MGLYQETSDRCLLTWDVLANTKWTFASPFRLQLEHNQFFYSEKIVRFFPGKRLLAIGQWQNKRVFAKIFFNFKMAEICLKRDSTGIDLLLNNHIPTPAIYYKGKGEDPRLFILLFEYIDSAKTLEEIWQNKNNIEEILPLLHRMMHVLSDHHQKGVQQKDNNLGNYLITDHIIYTIDGYKIRSLPPPYQSKRAFIICLYSLQS